MRIRPDFLFSFRVLKWGLTNEKKLAISACNDLGLFSREYDPKIKEMMGNFPQAITYLSFVSAAALGENGGIECPEP